MFTLAAAGALFGHLTGERIVRLTDVTIIDLEPLNATAVTVNYSLNEYLAKDRVLRAPQDICRSRSLTEVWQV